MNIRQAGAELFHAVGRTDVTKLIVIFRIFANAPKTQEAWILEIFIIIQF